MEEHNFEQQCAIKFCVKPGETGIRTFNKLKQAYGEHALSRSQVFKWYKAFSDGRESIKDEPHSGRPSTSKTYNNVEKVRALVRSDCRLTVWIIASELNLNHSTVHQILTQELIMRKLCVKIVPKTWQSNRRTIGRTYVFIFWNGSKVTEISWRMWLQVTKHGSLSMIQKQKDKARNGTLLHHHV